MNKVITINLNGNAYQLEEDGFEALRAYLDLAGRRLEGNPDRQEIIDDIEQAIADKFRAVLSATKTVVVTREVQEVIAQMGPVQDVSTPVADATQTKGPTPSGAGPAASAKGAAQPTGAASNGRPKRLFKLREGAIVGGVCNGLAAYLGIDVTIIRVVFAFLTLTFGAGALLYLLMMIIIPAANTAEEMAAAEGVPSTAEEFIRRAKEGYYAGMRSFKNRKAFREWKWNFKRDMRGHGRQFQKEMRRNARQWGHQWKSYDWHRHDGPWVAAPFLTLVIVAVMMLGALSIVSLVLTGAVFGILPPAGLPLWASILLLVVLFRLLSWPLLSIRSGFGYGPAPGDGHYGPFQWVWHSFGWVLFILIFVWWASDHSPHTHQLLKHVRREAHRTVESLRAWWASQ